MNPARLKFVLAVFVVAASYLLAAGMLGRSLVVAVATGERVYVVSALALTAGFAYIVGRERPRKRASTYVCGRIYTWRKGDRLWPVALGYAVVHPLRFAWYYGCAVWRARRPRRAGERP